MATNWKKKRAIWDLKLAGALDKPGAGTAEKRALRVARAVEKALKAGVSDREIKRALAEGRKMR